MVVLVVAARVVLVVAARVRLVLMAARVVLVLVENIFAPGTKFFSCCST